METKSKEKPIVYISVWLLISFYFLFMVIKSYTSAKWLASRNIEDSLILLVELATEPGPDYNESKTLFSGLLLDYAKHMEGRRPYPLLLWPPLSKRNIVKEMRRIAGDLENADQTNAREAIERASKSITEFLAESKLFAAEPIITFEPEVMPEELQVAIKESLRESHEKAEIFTNDPNMANSEAAYQANRKAIVYLYLARSGYQEIVSQEELRTFRTDLNRTIYYNRFLRQTDAVKIGEGVEGSDYWRLGRYSNSEILRLRLLQAIIDNDMQQAQVLLQMAVTKAIRSNLGG